MMNKLFLKPHHLPLFSTPNFLSPHKSLSSSLPISHFTTSSHSPHSTSLSYGPSLHKGTTKPSQFLPHHDNNFLHEESFTRVFDIAAIRVPSKDCFTLENKLRGHLLNWPRVRNVARVPGDDVDPDVLTLLESQNNNGHETDSEEEDEASVVSLHRRIYGKAEGDGDVLSPVLYRDKLARTFNSRGYVKFRNLAKISRPKRRKKKKEKEEGKSEGDRRIRKNSFASLVEVVEEGSEELKNLLGEEFTRSKWVGPTRLLLLDESYAGKEVEDLPQAIQAVFSEYVKKRNALTIELVKCQLTLFYDYWQVNEILEALLPEGMIVPSGFEIVGHIAHLNLSDEHLPYKKLIAKVVLDKNKPKIKTVVNKIDCIHNEYRTMQLEVLAGNHSLVTTVVENGICFQVDLATVYWNSRLNTERQRLLNSFARHDVVCDVFSGVGPIAISAAKIVKRVFANDLNPYAVEYLERNCVHNKLERKIEVFNMDGRRFIKALFDSDKARSITQVVMNLPNDAAEYLDAFRGIYRNRPKDEKLKFPKIHVYGFSKAQDPEFEFHERITVALREVAVNVDMRRVRLVAPEKWMLCASFILPESVAFSATAVDS